MRFGQQYDCEMQLKLLSNSTSQKLSTPQPRFRKLSHATTEPRSRDLRARAVSKCTETKHATSRTQFGFDSLDQSSFHRIPNLWDLDLRRVVGELLCGSTLSNISHFSSGNFATRTPWLLTIIQETSRTSSSRRREVADKSSTMKNVFS
jgi:hypothetical protein